MDGSIMLEKVLGQVYRSGLNCARKNTVGLYGHKWAKEALASHKETTTQFSKGTIKFDSHRWANSAHQCAGSTPRRAKSSVPY